MAKGKSDQKASKGIPRKSRNPQRKVRRARNASKQPERKLRHMLKRNSMRDAFNWASKYNSLAVLRGLVPDYQKQLEDTKYA